MKAWICLLLLLASLAPARPASAQAYPSKPVHIILGVAPGTASDVTVRVLANELGRKFKRRFLVENKPGANGAIGAGVVAAADPDGYTLLFAASSALTLTPHLDTAVPWNPLTDLVPIVEIGTTPIAIAVSRSNPIGTLSELVARAKAQPGQIKAGILPLSMSDFAMRLLEKGDGVKFRPVPYTGGSDLIGAALSGEVDVVFLGVGGIAAQFAPGGALKPLAMTTASRIGAFPDTPTVAESLPGYDAGSWFGFFGPKGLDPAVVTTLNKAVNEIIQTPAMKASLDALGTTQTGGPPEALRQRLEADYARFGALIKQQGLKVN